MLRKNESAEGDGTGGNNPHPLIILLAPFADQSLEQRDVLLELRHEFRLCVPLGPTFFIQIRIIARDQTLPATVFPNAWAPHSQPAGLAVRIILRRNEFDFITKRGCAAENFEVATAVHHVKADFAKHFRLGLINVKLMSKPIMII